MKESITTTGHDGGEGGIKPVENFGRALAASVGWFFLKVVKKVAKRRLLFLIGDRAKKSEKNFKVFAVGELARVFFLIFP